MAFDAAAYVPASPIQVLPAVEPLDAAGDLCPAWTAENPDRALALLFVAPRACAAVDVLVSL
ncbi:hypothetical protein [Brevundimonas sp.]|uniref:hypothetical protein n=1 Tax=Brevundimonas sp. TaxID=1871086 RepID=UPI002FC8DC51